MISSQKDDAAIILEKREPHHGLVDMLFKHEERIRDIETGMDKLNDLTKNTNHHLSNMRISLQLLKPITESVEAIEESVEKNEKGIEDQEKKHTEHQETIEKRIESIGSWVKWGVTLIVSMAAIFFVAATALKIIG